MALILEEKPSSRKIPTPAGYAKFDELARSTGVSATRLQKLAKAGLIKVRLGGHRGRGRFSTESEVLAAEEQLADAIPSHKVEEVLGIDRVYFPFLERVGLLTVDECAARLTNSPAYSAQALHSSLARVSRPHNRATSAVRLANVVSQKCGRAAPWAAIFAVLATHEGCGTGEHRDQFDWRRDTYVPDPEKFWDEVKLVSENIDRDIGSGDTVSAREAALILQIDSNQFYKLRPSGAFDHCIREANRHDRSLLQSFRSEHLYGLRLARRCGCQGMNGSIATRLYSLGVREAFPNAAMKIFRRRDVEAAIPHERHLLQT